MADGAASPYVAIAALLHAALLGIDRGYPLPEPETQDGLETISTDRHTPHDLGSALDALEADTALVAALGPDLVANYLSIKREELNELS
ncbi:hypothetical protein ABTM75_19465, partial [Acinetobacter baumannii]